jgi:crossover junction endodeoxyribonuclease RuvC
MSDARRVLGIDPGLAATGYCVLEGDSRAAATLASGVIRTRSSRPRAERLRAIYEGVCALLEEYRPGELAIEQQFVAANVRSAFAIGEARAAAMVAAALAGVPVIEYPPATIKAAVTGHGGASKEQVQAMVALQLGLRELPEPLDAADALAVALTRLAEAGLEARLAGR